MDARGELKNFRGVSTPSAVILFKTEKASEIIGWGLGAKSRVVLGEGHRFAPQGATLTLPAQMPEKAISYGWPPH